MRIPKQRHRQRDHARLSPIATLSFAMLKSAGVGATVGALLAVLFLLVGLGGYTLATLSGHTSKGISSDELKYFGWYLLAFTFAGAFVGGVRGINRRPSALVVALAIGGAIITNVIAIADPGRQDAPSSTEFLAMTAIGALFGLAGAYGYFRR